MHTGLSLLFKMFLNKTNGTKGNKGIDEGSTIEEGEQ
jgi:hypothetical protein